MKKPALALMWAALVLASVLFCIAIVDRPLADFAASHAFRIRGSRFVIGAPGLLLGVALVLPILSWRSHQKHPGVGRRNLASLCSISVLWTAAAVELVLKRVFGRLGPTSWLDYHKYGFHWLRGQKAALQSMPSGEMALLTAAIGIFWVIYPRWRWLYILILGAEGVGLIWLKWHFASDVIAGAAVGALGAVLALQLGQKRT